MPPLKVLGRMRFRPRPADIEPLQSVRAGWDGLAMPVVGPPLRKQSERVKWVEQHRPREPSGSGGLLECRRLGLPESHAHRREVQPGKPRSFRFLDEWAGDGETLVGGAAFETGARIIGRAIRGKAPWVRDSRA
jgi:hypothetical protein